MIKTVLICDDDEGIVDVASIVLQEKGYRVISCTSSKNIYALIKKEQPDLLFLDLWMPQLSGEMITKQLKGDPTTQQLPIIIFSASKDAEAIAESAGADGCLRKPFDILELEKNVERYIGANAK